MTQPHPFFGEVISAYSRDQALEDGVLVDISAKASEVGFRWPAAITASVWSDINAGIADGQSVAGRVWDVVWMAMLAAKGARGGQRVSFQVMIGRKTHDYVMVIGPGDTPSPVLTIMQTNED